VEEEGSICIASYNFRSRIFYGALKTALPDGAVKKSACGFLIVAMR
jgi:hypothetical protein